MTESPGERFADDAHRYRLDSRIATGGMGEVWRGTDTVLGRAIAVKLLKAEYADHASFRSRFETEARHAASLHHPNVAAVYDFGEASSTDGSGVHRPYLVMELVDGQPLSALLTPGQPLDPDATRGLLAQAADALGAAHAAGIVHRDVKPANLLVTPDRQVKITDFGIARAAEGVALTETGQVMGTPQYLSPEQAEGKQATSASDVYSLGVVAFECLAGRRPFVAETAIATALAHLRTPVPELPADVPADLATVVRRAMSKNPAERFPDATAFAAALRDPATAATAVVPADPGATQVLGRAVPGAVGAAAAAGGAAGDAGAAVAPAPTPVSTPAPRRGHARGADGKRRALVALIVLLALVLVAGLVYALTTGGGEADNPADQPTRHPSRTGKPSAPSSSASTTPSRSPSKPASSTPVTPSSSATPKTPSPSASVPATPSVSPTPSPSPSAPTSSAPAATTSSAPATPLPAEASPSAASSVAPADAAAEAPADATTPRHATVTSGKAASR